MSNYSVGSVRRRLDRLRADYDHAERTCREEQLALDAATQRLQTALQAQRLAQETAEHVQEQAHRQISSVVTRCLQTVFGDDAPGFRIRFEQKRGKTDAVLVFVKEDGLEVEEPTEADSGGLIDVAAFALRLACLMLSRPPLRRVLLLDENFKFVSQEYREGLKNLLLELSESLNLQIIMVTHIQELVAGTVIQLE